MSTTDIAKPLATLLKRLRGQYTIAPANGGSDSSIGVAIGPSSLDPAEPLMALMLRSILLWDAPSLKAIAAMQRLEQSLVDYNELRVCLPSEITRMLGERYPKSQDRSVRIRSILSAIYAHDHRLTLEPIMSLSKAKASEYLSSLDGMPEFVVARLMLYGLGAHSAPVDSRILRRLREAGIVGETTTPEQAALLLEKHVSTGELTECCALLQAFADDAPVAVAVADPQAQAAEPDPAPPPTKIPLPMKKPVSKTSGVHSQGPPHAP